MNFTPKMQIRPAISGILTVAVVGLMVWASHVAPTPGPMVATQQALQTSGPVPIVRGVQPAVVSDMQAIGPQYYQPISSWYKSKHWWKRNAPIIGGAGGGALVGGLIGGGPGALIGGAAGGGGGALYKHYRHKHHRYH